MKLLEGRNAIVTGGAQGIGRATALMLAEHGARVVVADLDERTAQAVVDGLPQGGAAVRCDVRDPDDARAAVAACQDLGSVDVVVNNAGITRDATLRKLTMADWDAVLDVHLKGAFLMSQAAAAVMREQGRGAIVNISSISGKVGMIGQANYSAAKAGMVGLTKATAKELAHRGVRVNAVQPGLIRTAMTEALRQDVWDQKMSEIPMGRAGEPEEVAKVVLFLASDLSSYLTGTVLEVTGGRFM
ncbi:3-oxoacyl-ACP reductase FabG [Blastococcus deserti]|uniref:3-oxoacyl-ACP reductase FabG n=1 Tax=Blastococcus deserti TaxID=2259033 RepID=A0ABW4X7E2_9ACTN